MRSREILEQVEVSGRANIFCAGLMAIPPDIEKGGEVPNGVSIGPGRDRIVKVASINVIECINPGEDSELNRLHGPDGSRYTMSVENPDKTTTSLPLHTNFRSNHGISGIKAVERAMFLVGVFLPREGLEVDAAEVLRFGVRPADSDPNYEYIDYSFPSLKPKLRQTFFIGDGRTDLKNANTPDTCKQAGTGAPQEFIVPRGAGSLYLGFADGNHFGNNDAVDIDYEGGLPGFYDGNLGQLTVTLSITGAWQREGEGDEEE